MKENIDRYLAIATLGFALVSASIYAFVLGFLQYFQVPVFPSLFSAQAFFFSSFLVRNQEGVESLSNRTGMFLLVSVILISTFLYFAFPSLKEKVLRGDGYRKLLILAPTVALVLFVLVVVARGSPDALKMAAAVLFSPLLSYLLLRYISMAIQGPGEAGQKLLETVFRSLSDVNVGALAVLMLLLVWAIPYYVGQSYANRADPSKKFVRAQSSSRFRELSLLVWQEEARSFWLYCDVGGGIIYGVTDDGNSFFSRPLDDNISSRICLGK